MKSIEIWGIQTNSLNICKKEDGSKMVKKTFSICVSHSSYFFFLCVIFLFIILEVSKQVKKNLRSCNKISN